MNRVPAVSVIITCYNLGAYLAEAVDSVLAQTCQDFEILIVDDGSTDPDTRTLIDSYRQPNTRILRTANAGLPAARNAGARATSSRYLCMLDADDRLEPMYLERSLGALEADPQLAFASHWLRTFGSEVWEWRPTDCSLEALLEKNQVNGAALMRRAAFDAIGGFDESMREGLEDWDFWLSLVKRGYHGAILPEILFNYRRRAGSMSQLLTDGIGEGYARLYRRLAEKHADVFLPRLPALLAASERELADLRVHLHDLELEYHDWLAPALQHAADDVAVLERKARRERARQQDARERQALTDDLQRAVNRVAHLEGAVALATADAEALRHSLSWRVTRPLRAALGWWLTLRKRGGGQ